MESTSVEKMEKFVKEEVEICVQEKLHHCLFEEIKEHLKLMEDNMIKRMEEIAKVSKVKPGDNDSSVV